MKEKPESAREHQKGARECQGSDESARESKKGPKRARMEHRVPDARKIPPKNFPQVFKPGFFLRFLKG